MSSYSKSLAFFLVGTSLVSCAPSSSMVNLSIGLPQKDAKFNLAERLQFPQTSMLNSPSTVDGFDCYAVNVFGNGIGNGSGNNTGTQGCSYLGATSTLASSNQSTINLQVPQGAARTIQMIGVATGSGCDTTMTLAQLQMSQPQPTPGSTPSFFLNELGRTTTDLYRDTQVTIQNTYTGAGSSTSYPFACNFGQPLPLAAGYTGGDSSNLFTDTVSAAMPPIASNSTPIPVGQLSAISAPMNSSTQYFAESMTSSFQAADLLFSTSGIDTTKYPNFRVEASFAGGGTAFSSGCPNPNLIGNGYNGIAGAKLSVYKASSSSWSTNLLDTGNVLTFLNSSFEYRTEANIAQATVTLGGSPFILVSLRSQGSADGGSAKCSDLAINYVRVIAIP